MQFRSPSRRSEKWNKPKFGERVDASFVAGLMGCTRQHLTRLCRAGKVPGAYQSIGGHWRMRWSRQLAISIASNQRFPSTIPAGTREERMRVILDQVDALSEQRTLIDRKISRLWTAHSKVSLDGIPISGLAAFADKLTRGSQPLPQPSKPKAAR